MSKRIVRHCVIDGCNNFMRTRGLCNKHYLQAWRNKDIPVDVVELPDAVIPEDVMQFVRELRNYEIDNATPCNISNKAWRDIANTILDVAHAYVR